MRYRGHAAVGCVKFFLGLVRLGLVPVGHRFGALARAAL